MDYVSFSSDTQQINRSECERNIIPNQLLYPDVDQNKDITFCALQNGRSVKARSQNARVLYARFYCTIHVLSMYHYLNWFCSFSVKPKNPAPRKNLLHNKVSETSAPVAPHQDPGTGLYSLIVPFPNYVIYIEIHLETAST